VTTSMVATPAGDDRRIARDCEATCQRPGLDHQPDRHARPAHVRVIELAEPRLEHVAVDQAGRPHQRVAPIDLLAETGAKEVIRLDRIRPAATHRNRRMSTAGSQLTSIHNLW